MKNLAKPQAPTNEKGDKADQYLVLFLSIGMGLTLAVTTLAAVNSTGGGILAVPRPWLFALAIILYLGSFFLGRSRTSLRVVLLGICSAVLVAATTAHFHFVGFNAVLHDMFRF